MHYAHTQQVPKKVMAVAAAAGLALGLTPPGFIMRLVTLGALGGAAAVFRSLTVEMDDESISLRFGDGLVTKKFALKDISSVEKTRTNLIQGWGIHWVGNGWLYNVYGLDAVELRFNNGKRTLVGTDDADNLVAALQEAMRSLS